MKSLRRAVALALACVMALGGVPSALAVGSVPETYYVANHDTGGSDSGDGSSAKPFLSIQSALEHASGDEVVIEMKSDLSINNILTLGEAGPTSVRVKGNGKSLTYEAVDDNASGTETAGIVVADGASVALEDLTVTRPAGNQHMTRLLYVKGSATLDGVSLTNGNLSVSDVENGGSAIRVAPGGRVDLEGNTRVSGNRVHGQGASGAVFVAWGGTLNLYSAEISGNGSAAKGSGVYVEGTMNVWSDGADVTVSDEVYVEVGAKATVGAADGQSSHVTLSRVFLESDETSVGAVATLDIKGETTDSTIGIEVLDEYHDVYRLVSAPSGGYAIDTTPAFMDEAGWSDLDGVRDIRYMDYKGVPGLYFYHHTLDATFHDVSTLTDIDGKDITGTDAAYWTEKAVQNASEAGGVLTIPELIPVDSGEDYVITFACDEANKEYRIPRPEVVELTLDGTVLTAGTDYEYVPDYAAGTATLTVKAAALEGAGGTLDFKISAEKYALLTLAMNGPVYTMSTSVTKQAVTKALSVDVEGMGTSQVDYLVTRDGVPVEGVSVILYREGTADEVGTAVTDAQGKARFAGSTELDPAYAYYYVLYYEDSFYVIAADETSLQLSTLQGQHLSDRCEYDATKAEVSYTVVDAENYSKSTSAIKGVTADTKVTYYVDLAQDEIRFVANQGDATTADTATFTFADGRTLQADSTSKRMETNVVTYGDLPSMTMIGYDFLGWFTAAEGGEQVEPDTAYDTVESPKVLYAHWTPRNDRHYEVRHWVEYTDYGVNARYEDGVTETKTVDGTKYYLWRADGYDDGTADATLSSVADKALTNMEPATTQEHSWWVLDGFDVTADTDCKVLADGTAVFGCYYDRKPYGMTFDPAPGVMSGEASTKDCRFGVDVGDMLEAQRSGYRAGGWYYDVDGDAQRDADEALVTATSRYTWTEDVTVRQQWVNSDTTYEVKLLAEDLSHDEAGLGYADGSYTVYTVKSGIPGTSDVETEVSLSDIAGTDREGFTYVGYSTVMDEHGEGMTPATDSFTVTPSEVADETVVYLYYDRNEVTVHFMADDRDADIFEVFKDVTVAYGDTFGAALPDPAPTKPGHGFTGWVDVDGNPVTGDTRTDGYAAAGGGEMKLWPVWDAREYRLTYVPRTGATLDMSGMGADAACGADAKVPGGYVVSKAVTYDRPMGAMPTASKTGHVFLGWAVEGFNGYVTADTVVGVDNVVVANEGNVPEETRPLYAQFRPYAFTLSFDAAPGTVSPESVTVVYGMPISELPTPTRESYSFNGWAYDLGAAGQTRIQAGDIWTYEANDGDTVTVHALWQPLTYSYRLHLNDVDEGNGSTKAVLFNSDDLSVDIVFGTPYADVLDGVAAQRNGYTFLGWSTSRDLSDLITDETVSEVAGDADVYAMWRPNVYGFAFDLNGGSPESEETFPWNRYGLEHYAAYKDAYGVELRAESVGDGKWDVPVIFDTVYGALETPVREHYLFEGYKVGAPGWFKGDEHVMDGKVVKSFDVAYTDNTDERITLDAVWTPYFDFVLNDAGAAFDDGATGTKTDLGSSGKLPVAVMEGYSFLGWWDDVSGKYVTLDDVLAMGDHRVFRAVFTPNVTFDANGGKVIVDGRRLDGFTIGLSELMAKYDDFFPCEKAGVTFMGWTADDGSDMSRFGNLASHGTPVTLTAAYDVTVTFCLPSNATWADGSSGERTYAVSDVSRMSALPEAKLSGYGFLGWFDVSTADGVTTRRLTVDELGCRGESSKVYAVFGAVDVEHIDVTVTNYGPAAIEVTVPAAGWVKGENTFSVRSGMGCVVALRRGGVYTALTQKRADGDVHTFTEDLRDGDELVVMLRGDVDLDGRVSITDASVLARALAAGAGPDVLQALSGDADIDGRASITDASVIARVLVNGGVLGWVEP